MHGTPLQPHDIGGVLKVSLPVWKDAKYRKFAMGYGAVCASIRDIDTPIRRALLHPNNPILDKVDGFTLARKVDANGSVWHFTTENMINRLREVDTKGSVFFWKDTTETPPFVDQAGLVRENERWIRQDVPVSSYQYTTVTVDDFHRGELAEDPENDLIVINAGRVDTLRYLSEVGKTDNILTLGDDMGIELNPIGGVWPLSLYPH